MTAKQSSAAENEKQRPFVLPLRIKPNGVWGYKFGKLRRAQKRGRL